MNKLPKISNSSKTYTADLVSGGEGCIFLTSVLNPILKIYDANEPFPFRWYGLNFYTKKKFWEEHVKWDLFKEQTENIIDYALRNKDMKYFRDSEKRIIKTAEEFQYCSYNLIKKLPSLSNDELKDEYMKWTKKYFTAFGYGVVTFVYETYAAELLDESLRRYENHNIIIQSLIETKFKSFMIYIEEMLKKIRDADNPEKDKLKEEFKKQFFFVKTNYYWGKVLDDHDIEELMIEADHTQGKVANNLPDIELTEKEKAIVSILKAAIPIRDNRKKINLIGGYTMSRFVEEISRRVGVAKEILQNAFWHEIFDVFTDDGLAAELKKREDASIVFENGKEIFSDEIIIESRKSMGRESTLEGISASLGKAKGKVKLIIGPENFSEFKNGEILVTFATRPEFMPVIKKAKAIITQEGGITSHAAIVCRELGKPCIVGVKGLMDNLKGGDLVEVDADNGVVRKIK